MTGNDILVTVLVSVLTILLVLSLVVALLVVSSNRQLRHRSDLAEADLRREQEVLRAEREATQHTLREVGRDLHDNVAQLLTVAQLGLNMALEDPVPDQRLLAARDALDQGIEEVRRLGHDLNSDLWRNRTLTDAITAEAARIERTGRLRCAVHRHGEPPALPPDTSTILFRVFQEVVNNALKHSGADALTITVDGTGPFTLTIADNGIGFDLERAQAHGGLVNIARRCAVIGYAAQCTTAPGEGCRWTLQPAPAHA